MSKRLLRLYGFRPVWGLFFVLVVLTSCITSYTTHCDLLCELEIDPTQHVNVAALIDRLLALGWIQEDVTKTMQAEYARDTFSNVLETTTVLDLDRIYPEGSAPRVKLYIGYVGGIQPQHEIVPTKQIELIALESHLSVFETLFLYGLPEGGQVFPIYSADDLQQANPCPDRSHYVAYYHDGRTIIRAVVRRPIWLKLWFTPIEIVYPLNDDLEFARAVWSGRYERMDHIPCMP